MALAWILGGAAIVGGYFLLRGDKKKKKDDTSDRRAVEVLFGRLTLAIKQCGPLPPELVDTYASALETDFDTARTVISEITKQHCPAVFDVPEAQVQQEGALVVQSLETAIGLILVTAAQCPELIEGDQLDQIFSQFSVDLIQDGPLGSVSKLRGRVIPLCPTVESISGEEILRRGREHVGVM